MKTFILHLYWRLCQYPWYHFAGIIQASFLYWLAVIYGKSIRILLLGSLFGFSDGYLLFFLYLFLDFAILYIIFSILFVILTSPFLLHKGIVFNVLGYTFFYWFLFFPLHLFVDITKEYFGAHTFNLLILLLGIIISIMFVISLFYFPNHITKTKLVITTNKIGGKIKIIHLSDIHAERYGLRECNMVSIVNKEGPDIILISGDMFNLPYEYNTKGFNAAVKILKQLKTKYGIWIVNGHHDYGKLHHITELLSSKVRVLNDQWAHFNDYEINISIFGASLYSNEVDFVDSRTSNNYKMYFAHNPNCVKNLKQDIFSFALFGHTHACQVYIPIISNLIVGAYRHGLHKHNGIPIYINAGIGMEGYLAPRIRWFTNPEVVVLDLIPKTY